MPPEITEWNERMGVEDGVRFWMRIFGIPIQFDGDIWPLPTKRGDCFELLHRIEQAHIKHGIPESYVIDFIPDQRTLLHLRKIYYILSDTDIDTTQAFRDAFRVRMEQAPFYVSWREWPSDVALWLELAPHQQDDFLGKSFENFKQCSAAWHERCVNPIIEHSSPQLRSVITDLRRMLNRQQALKRSLAILREISQQHIQLRVQQGLFDIKRRIIECKEKEGEEEKEGNEMAPSNSTFVIACKLRER